MNEKSEKVLEQYDISINRVVRGRGGLILGTDKGCKLFLPCGKSDKFYEREDRITRALKERGFINTDTYMRNLEGGLISEDIDGRKYVLKDWFDARESDVKSLEDMSEALRTMASMHKVLKEIGPQLKQQENKGGAATESKAESESQENAGNADATLRPELAACGSAGQTGLRDTYERHTRELKKAYNYLRTKKGKQHFEQMAYKNIEGFYQEASQAVTLLNNPELDERLLKAVSDNELCHGSFNYHNVFLDNKTSYVTNFDRCRNECQVWDLYQFIRKVMEKHDWESSVFYRLVDEYDRVSSICENDFYILVVLLSYPEKFWKIINQYLNANKSWIPDKNVDKLQKVIWQNQRRRELIDKICCIW
ncbi:MAG: hypothetical protein Q4F06_02880 [Eubacteriales bacterium]|nr:hypothetical protein [Eubacteriales bacterium]